MEQSSQACYEPVHALSWATAPCLALLLLLTSTLSAAQDVRLVGTVGTDRAIVVLGDGTPKTLTVGQSRDGVTLIAVERNTAIVSTNGEQFSLKLGHTPTRVDGSTTQSLRMAAQQGGHYLAEGQINGQAVQFLVDTGASTVSLDAQLATKLGIDFRKGQSVSIATANGKTQGWLISLPNVRVGTLQQTNVSATVVQEPMPFVLLGNSFLNHYRMTRDASAMVLESR